MPLKASLPTARELADLCLQHLAQDPEQLAEFMVQSGLTPDHLRKLAGTDGFARGLIDYVVANEPLLLAIAADAGLSPEAIMRVWGKLHAAEH